jgi:3-carboxy-cis,cis-muconate cycloisomerase
VLDFGAVPSDGLLDPLFAPAHARAAVGDEAWLQAMLDFEAALATVQARLGLIPGAAARAIVGCCRAENYDAAELGRAALGASDPGVPLVAALRAAAGADAAPWVNWGAASQDVVDTATMLVARAGSDAVLVELDSAADACARLAREHRATPLAGRALLQQAGPITFGLKAAGWLTALRMARGELRRRRLELRVQLGGVAGTLAPFGADGPAVARALAFELGLAEPSLPWHAARGEVALLGAALAVAAGGAGKAALDVTLLAQTEVGEVAEVAQKGSDGSPAVRRRQPVAAVRARACAQRAAGEAAQLLACLAHEHEGAAGAWHAEWLALRETITATAGALRGLRDSLDGLDVDAERMRANLDPALLADRMELDDPLDQLGATNVFIDRALAGWERAR